MFTLEATSVVWAQNKKKVIWNHAVNPKKQKNILRTKVGHSSLKYHVRNG